MEDLLASGRRRIVGFFPRVKVHEVPVAKIREFDPEGRTFRNINTPEEYFGLRGGEVEGEAAEKG